MPAQLALATAENGFQHASRLLAIPFHLVTVTAVGNVIEIELNAAAAMHDILAIVASQCCERRADVLFGVVRLGHCLSKRLIGLTANLFEHRLLVGDRLQVFRQRHSRRIACHKQTGAGNIDASVLQNIFDGHADGLPRKFESQHGAIVLLDGLRLAIADLQGRRASEIPIAASCGCLGGGMRKIAVANADRRVFA